MAIKQPARHHRLAQFLLAVTSLLAAAHPAHADDGRRSYIVQLADQPLAAYRGNISGLRATKVAPGQRLDISSNEALQYRNYLGTKQAQAKALLPAANITHQYQVVFNGFAARLTDAEVRTLKASGKVASITPDERNHIVTSYTPTFLGLDQPGGLWEQLGGRQHAGEDVIVGVIDTGAWPENLSYADRVDGSGKPTFDGSGTLAYGAPPARWKGVCQSGEGFTAADCNNKLIGARYFDAGFRASGLPTDWSEFRSPRDSLSGPAGLGGHGTHTSSTAVGNDKVPAVAGNGNPLGVRTGMAPRARLAVYKVCWTYKPGSDDPANTCFSSDSVAAIEAAVADGVDVLNFSISGGETPVDPVEQAFRHAVEAGVFVAAAAGNDGPGNEVNHVGPWLATVAAAAHDKTHTATVTLGNGQTYSGVSINAKALPATKLIRGADAAANGASVDFASLCLTAADANGVQLDPAKVAGKVVVCQRGNNARTAKAEAVRAAGGVGMIMLDDGNGPLIDMYSVPTVHMRQEDGAAIDAYAAAAGATAAMSASALTDIYGPTLAEFSSRGPNRFDPGVLKPDMAAPGVDIVAGVSPSLSAAQRAAVVAGTGPSYSYSAFMSGTSMATPHVAGLAALLKQRHPGWSPAAIKSALMTTTRSVLPTALTGDQDGTLPWGQGAGLVVPNGAADPGLVYDIAAADYLKYVCDITGDPGDCNSGTIKGQALNLASISLPGVVGLQSVTRSVTNVGERAAIYTATGTLDGFDVVVTPSTLQLAPGETASYKVGLTRTSAMPGIWQTGELVWNDGEHNVRSPLQARYNDGVEAPVLVSATTTSGSRQIDVQTGFDGKLSVDRAGLREYTRLAQTVTQATPGSLESLEAVTQACVARGPGVKAVTLAIPKQTMLARFEISNHETAGGADDDLDLAVLDQWNNLVAFSAHTDANESVTLVAPPMGVFKACVLGYKLKNGASTNYTLSYATAIPNDTKGNMKVTAPASVHIGGTSAVVVSWSGLEQGKHYLGGVQMANPAGGVKAVTELNIDTRDVTPATGVAVTKRLNMEK
jgi:subtilisin family serine protease